MSSKEKDNTMSKLKQFFRGNKNTAGGIRDDTYPESIEKELNNLLPDNPVQQRCRSLNELTKYVANTKLEEAFVIKLWQLTKDLVEIKSNRQTEYRHSALIFYKNLFRHQSKNLVIMREFFFNVIKDHDVDEDLQIRVDMMVALSENGRQISKFEERIGQFMLDLAPLVLQGPTTLIHDFLDMLANLIQYNASHLESVILVGFVNFACHNCLTVNDEDIVTNSMKILELVMSYAMFPSDALFCCVGTLCRTVNNPLYCEASWKNMKNLLGIDLGHSALTMMCNMLKDRSLYESQDLLLRGAVFHTCMGVFGINSQTNKVPLASSTVLFSYLKVLECKKIIVTFEIIQSIALIIPKYNNLPERLWDVIFQILNAIADNIRHYDSVELMIDPDHVKKPFHKTIDDIEQKLKASLINADLDNFYDLIEKISDNRSDESVKELIKYRSSQINTTRPQWLQSLQEFIKRFYHTRNADIRIQIINSLIEIMDANRAAYEEEILERVVIPEFTNVITFENNMHVRLAIINALISFAIHCDTRRCCDILEMLQNILNRPFLQYDQHGYVISNEEEAADIICVINGLIEIFNVKLYRLPSSNAIHVFNIIVNHLERHYKQPIPFSNLSSVRYKIFHWMLKARANSIYHIGYPDKDGCIRFSHYLGVDTTSMLLGHDQISANTDVIPQTNFTTVSITRACGTIISALRDDNEYIIFNLIITELPSVLQNKALIQGNSIDNLAEVLINIPSSRKKFQQSTDDFNTLMLPSIASLVIHHQTIQIPKLELIMECLKKGLNQKAPEAASTCINTLTIMVLERHDVLNRKLKDVLLTMSKMTDTQAVAIPVLEFLSILCQLPNQLFASYIPMEHMYIFAAIMPYTKPYKYSHYIVSLAYHVIAKWFLKNKPVLRRNYVKYIISSIETSTKLLNEDSSNRKRSTSLTERGNRAADNLSTKDIVMDENRMYHEDLAETCIDFLARHTYSPFSALPKRLPVVETLLKDGISQSWLIGHNVMTITTSNCSSVATNSGFCERCCLLNRQPTSSSSNFSLSEKAQQQNSSRYTKASLQYSNATESCGSSDLTGNTTLSSMSSYHLSIEGNNANSKSTSRQASTSSTGSIDIPSRRGSNPDALNANKEQILALSNTNLYSTNASSDSSIQQKVCARSCTGWAELCIRRPTGIISWVMRIQNPISTSNFPSDLPFCDLISLFLPSIGGIFGKDFLNEPPINNVMPQHQPEEEPRPVKEKKLAKPSSKIKPTNMVQTKASAPAIDIPNMKHKYPERHVGSSYSDDDEDKSYEDSSGKSRNPVRRVNSSPEMRSKYLANREKEREKEEKKERQLQQQQQASIIADMKKKCFTKKSCEAIPEEITGSTPPQILPKQNSADDIIITNTSTRNNPNLNLNIPKENISSKPPSPAPLSPRTKNMSVNFSNDVSNNSYDKNQRGRANTISVVRGVNKNTTISFLQNGGGQATKTASSKLGISPSFLLLQLYHTGQISAVENPIKISPDNTSSINILDLIPPLDIHKIGVLYVGPGQCNNEAEILRNRHGSTRYIDFLKNLGTLVSLKNAKENNLFINLETNGADGLFTYVWMDDIMQVIFHVATLMPTKESDPKCNEKKKHIGNDYVSIVYNESGEEYSMSTIRGQCNHACVVVEPIEMSTSKISILTKETINIGNSKPKIVSDRNAPLLARQLALHADLASSIETRKKNNPYASNWLERLRKIKNLRRKELQKVNRRDSNEVPSSGSSSDISKTTSPPTLTTNNFKQIDFTKYTEDS
ncbi:TSC2 family protein [Megaselia abdita]